MQPSWAGTLSLQPTATAFPTLGGLRWEQFATEYAFQTYNAELFGSSLALSDDGDIVTVGAFNYSNMDAGTISGGRVIRYDLSGSASATVVRGMNDYANLGYQVSVSGDGNRLATFDSNTGNIEIFEYSRARSSLIGRDTLNTGLEPISADFALSGDGKWLAIVGEQYNVTSFETKILVSLYEFDEQSRRLTPYGAPVLFGYNEEENWSFFDVSITHDGGALAVSLIGLNEFTGQIRVYERLPARALRQMGEPLISEVLGDGFGQDVEVLFTPTNEVHLGFSVPYDDMVYIYAFVNDAWSLVGTPLWAADFIADGIGSEWGFDITFNEDGDVLVIGAPAFRDSSGIIQAFRLFDGDWWPVGPTLGGPPESNFGEAVVCSLDCQVIAVGAPFDCSDQTTCGGNLYLFRDLSV